MDSTAGQYNLRSLGPQPSSQSSHAITGLNRMVAEAPSTMNNSVTVTVTRSFMVEGASPYHEQAGLSVERSGRVADDSLNARDTLGRNRPGAWRGVWGLASLGFTL